jgi:hypothetical protein
MRAGKLVSLLLLCGCVPEGDETLEERGPLAEAFGSASRELEVPERLLLAVGWVETQWRTPPIAEPDPDHVATGARGIMGVIDRPDLPRLGTAIDALGLDPALAAGDAPTNIRAAAFVLRELALETMGRVPARLQDWRPAVARYGSADDELAGETYADHVFEALEHGREAITESGERLVLTPSGKLFGRTSKALTGAVDFPGASWVPARQGHFVYGRYGYGITHVIIHTTEGSYDGAIGWFRSPSNPYLTSAHYVVRSSDGAVTQMVRESDTAHHIGGWNPWSIGIEHEAIAAQGFNWFTDAMLRSSAAITRAACLRYGIPMDRDHIRGHVEVPGASHVDPGPYFPWDYYMELVRDPNTTAPNLPSGCGNLDYIGECQGSVLRWCENGVVREVQCANSGQACGYQNDQIGYNCVSAPTQPVDPCGGLDYAGECQGSLLRWCEGGTVRSFDCSIQGETCGFASTDVGNNCIPIAAPSECDRLGYVGECSGTQLRWCESGVVRERDCAPLGQACAYQDDQIGYNCLTPPAVSECDALGYAGECQGSLLRWCENGAIQTFDCSSNRKACGWQSQDIGFNCLYTCESLGYVGTCDGEVLRWCENGSMRQQSCGALGQACGYQNDQIGFNCL